MNTSAAVGGMAGILILAILISFGAKIGLAFIPANIAKNKGYGFAGFFLLGLFFFFIGLIVSLCLDDKNSQVNQMQNAIYSANNSNMRQTTNPSDELIKYNTLLQQGAITQEEYDNLKTKIIGGASTSSSGKRFCPHCGQEQAQNSMFCENCGTKL